MTISRFDRLLIEHKEAAGIGSLPGWAWEEEMQAVYDQPGNDQPRWFNDFILDAYTTEPLEDIADRWRDQPSPAARHRLSDAPGCPAVRLAGMAERCCPKGIWCSMLPVCRARVASGEREVTHGR